MDLQKFTFNLSREFYDEPLLSYHAKLLNGGGTYVISWEDESDFQYCYYDENKVKQFIENGLWIIKEETNVKSNV